MHRVFDCGRIVIWMGHLTQTPEVDMAGVTGYKNSRHTHDRVRTRRTRGRPGKPSTGRFLLSGIAAGLLLVSLARLFFGGQDDVGQESNASRPHGQSEDKIHEPVFDFYTRLPELQIAAVPDSAAAVSKTEKLANSGARTGDTRPRLVSVEKPQGAAVVRSSAKAPSPATDHSQVGQTFMLQAGSFRNAGDADRLRVRLIMEGYNAKIVRGTVRDNSVWHRVQLGPYTTRQEVGMVQANLVSLGIDTLILGKRSHPSNR